MNLQFRISLVFPVLVLITIIIITDEPFRGGFWIFGLRPWVLATGLRFKVWRGRFRDSGWGAGSFSISGGGDCQ